MTVAHQFLLTVANFLPSAGSCLLMSGLSKMGWRYIQLRCTSSHLSNTSPMIKSLWFQASMRSSKGPLNAENCMACVVSRRVDSLTIMTTALSLTRATAPTRMNWLKISQKNIHDLLS